MIEVLIVEDHGVVRAGLESLFSAEENYRIVGSAGSGTEALDLMTDGIVPDVLLTGLYLEDMTGIALTEKALLRNPDLNVSVLTMESDVAFMAEAFRAGVKGYILKKAGVDELIYGLRKVSEGKRFICTGMTEKIGESLASGSAFRQQADTDVDLSRRESEILYLLADGFTNLQIADRLFTSKRTVEGHRQSLLNKTGVRNTPELVKYAMLHGLLRLSVS